jgi:FkbM family methyltransferase
MNVGFYYQVIKASGVRGGILGLAARAASKARPSSRWTPRRLRLREVSHPILLRPATSDWNVLWDIFLRREYDCPSEEHDQAIRRFYDTCVAESKTPLIIDCGANIGLASIWYAQKFPRAKIIAVEPEPENYRILTMNAANYPNIVPIQGGISDRETRLSLVNQGDAPWAWETIEADSGQVRSFTIPSLLKTVPDGVLMIVKIDIEGSEVDLFRSNVEWVAHTPVIVFEAHDGLFSWRGTFHAIVSILTKQPRDYLQKGENTFSLLHSMRSIQKPQGTENSPAYGRNAAATA